MTLLRWSYVGSFTDPIFLLSTLLFLVVAYLVAQRLASAMFAMEIGALCGFLYGVAVWGVLGYAYGFDGRAKLIFLGCALVDGIVLVTALQVLLHRIQPPDAA